MEEEDEHAMVREHTAEWREQRRALLQRSSEEQQAAPHHQSCGLACVSTVRVQTRRIEKQRQQCIAFYHRVRRGESSEGRSESAGKVHSLSLVVILICLVLVV